MHKTYGNVALLRNLMGVGDAVMLYDVKDIEIMFRNEGTWPRRQRFHSVWYYRNVMRKDVFGNFEGLLTR
jgi:cytochrome P450 family 12